MLKKSLIAAAFLATTSAFAQTTAFTTYDYDRKDGGSFFSQHELHMGLAQTTSIGTFDGALVGRQLVTSGRDDNFGFELGYSNGVKLGKVTVTGRLGFGQINGVNAGGGGFTGNSEYWSAGVEATLPITNGVTGFTSFRHRNGMNADTVSASNRTAVGAEVALTKSIALRAGYASMWQEGYRTDGLTTAVSYKF